MRGLLANHVHTELISDNLLQEARDWAKLQLLGNADNNVQYCEAVKAAIIGMGHSCEFLYCDRCDVIRQLSATVVREELKQREDKKDPALDRGAQTKEFIKNWLIDNDVPLTTQLDMHDGPPLKFLTGVFIATSTSKKQVPFVQDVIQADGAHMLFGKYTLFSAYTNSANGAMVSLGFAILFGNEDTSKLMKPAHAAYLELLQDNQQFPGAHCNKSHENMPDVYMYGLTSSSGVESMNQANDEARGKNAVDPLNAALVILKKEGHRFLRGLLDAHKVSRFSSCLLAPKILQSWKRYSQSVTLLSTICR